MKCEYDHTAVQIPDKDWKCPKCEAPAFIDNTNEDGWQVHDCVNYDCDELHNSDVIICHRCGYETTGIRYSKWYAKNKGAVKCPCCKGKGIVSKRISEMYMEMKKYFKGKKK